MNDSLREYLEYYTNLQIEPNYAVLINGDWGSGKTWFIKDYFEENDEIDHLYITLYGVNSLESIDEQFFQQLHPVLSNKGMMVAGKVLKGLAKGVLKIDLDTNGDAQGELNVGMPELNLPDFLKNTEDHIIVFDDLERADLKPELLLGYINQFVEHNGQKVIIIANEKEINNSKAYTRIKEKVVGRSFSVEPSFDGPFNSFLKNNENDSLKNALEEHKEKIQVIFESSKSNNLRHLRHGLTEFERLFGELKEACEECVQNEELISDLIDFYFAIFIEINRGNISAKHLKKFRTQIYGDFFRDNQDEDSEIVKMVRRYPTVSFDNIVLSENFWFEFFEKGIVDREKIKSLKNSSAYFDEEEPTWLKLWNYFYLSNEELDDILKEVEQKFDNSDFSNFSELAHISGSLIKLSDIGIYNKSKKEIYNEAQDQLDQLFDRKKIEISFDYYHRDITSVYNLGHQFQGLKIADFQNFIKDFGNRLKSEKNKLLKEKADELLELMSVDTKKFSSLISIHSSENYHQYSIISKFDQDKFIDTFKEISPKKRREIILSLSNRISNKSLDADETVWIEEVIQKLKAEFPSTENTIENYNVNKGIEKLENELS